MNARSRDRRKARKEKGRRRWPGQNENAPIGADPIEARIGRRSNLTMPTEPKGDDRRAKV